jgi:hypothetical protein
MPPSPDIWVMLHPGAAYANLARLPGSGGWILFRRPILVALVFGCVISLMTSGRLTLRLALPAAIVWSFVPLLEMASLAAVWHIKRPPISLPRAIDLFFMGHAPWSLWLVGFAAIRAFVPTVQVFAWMGAKWIWFASAFLAMAWSGYIDFHFFRTVLDRTAARAARDLVLQRLICWIGFLLIFLAPGAWSTLAPWLGL